MSEWLFTRINFSFMAEGIFWCRWSYPRVMQASLTTWERRSLAESLNAASMSRSCWGKPSNSATPARSKERTFFSWKNNSRAKKHNWIKFCWERNQSPLPPWHHYFPAHRCSLLLKSTPKYLVSHQSCCYTKPQLKHTGCWNWRPRFWQVVRTLWYLTAATLSSQSRLSSDSTSRILVMTSSTSLFE